MAPVIDQPGGSVATCTTLLCGKSLVLPAIPTGNNNITTKMAWYQCNAEWI